MLKNIMKKINPSLFYFLKEAVYTLNGWRFNDLKEHIKNTDDIHIKPNESILSSFSMLSGNTSDFKPTFCYISVLPPELTGVATCSYFTWVNYNKNLDFYTPVSSLEHFYYFMTKFGNESNQNVRLLDVKSLIIGEEINNYSLVIIAIANSSHNLYILDTLKEFINYRDIKKICLHIHDPVLFNIIAFSCQYNLDKFKAIIMNIYKDLDKNIIADFYDLNNFITFLVTQEKCGISFFYKMGITKFIVNSQSAYDKIKNEIISDDINITKAFHPIFLPIYDKKSLNINENNNQEIRIGSFGVPTNQKMLNTIIEAINILNNDGVKYKLIIAGFHAAEYFEQNKYIFDNLNYELHDNPSDFELLNLMNSVELAIQLRKNNFGESSGVVPQLLKLNKKIIVSDIGSFKEFEKCCYFYDNTENPSNLVDKIKSAINATLDVEEIASFVNTRSNKGFQKIIENMVTIV